MTKCLPGSVMLLALQIKKTGSDVMSKGGTQIET